MYVLWDALDMPFSIDLPGTSLHYGVSVREDSPLPGFS